MAINWHNASTWLRKALDSHQVADEVANPGIDNADNSEVAATEDAFFLPMKFRGKKVGATTAMTVVVVAILLTGARYIMSRKSRAYLTSPDDADIQKYLDDFNKASEGMEKAWESSGLAVREAFQRHFTPSLKDGHQFPKDPLATIRDHVAKMRECKVPSASSVRERQNFAQHLEILQTICSAVTFRLEELKWFVRVNEKKKVPVPVPGHDEPCSYPPLEVLEGRAEGGMTGARFLDLVGLVGGNSTSQVDALLAHKLLSLLAIENKHNAYNSVARYSFESLLQISEDYTSNAARLNAKYQIPYSGKPFRVGALARAAARIFRESDSTPTFANERKMHRIANSWNNKGVVEASKQQEKDNANLFEDGLKRKREQMRALLKEGIPTDDLAISALFLL